MKKIITFLLLVVSTNILANEYISYKEINWLPDAFVKTLSKENCLIPKNIVWGKVSVKIPVTGVIIGQFAKQGQYDIAVICNNKSKNQILIYWGGPTNCESKIKSWGESISIVGEDYIKEHYEAYGGTKPPNIEHGAINDALLGKSSIVYYCYHNNWLKLTGAD